jgi:hypothetical protein
VTDYEQASLLTNSIKAAKSATLRHHRARLLNVRFAAEPSVRLWRKADAPL